MTQKGVPPNLVSWTLRRSKSVASSNIIRVEMARRIPMIYFLMFHYVKQACHMQHPLPMDYSHIVPLLSLFQWIVIV
jgi:hypothetical protein